MQGSMIERYARLPIDSPRQIILFVALFTINIYPFFLKFKFEKNFNIFFKKANEVDDYDEINKNFGRD